MDPRQQPNIPPQSQGPAQSPIPKQYPNQQPTPYFSDINAPQQPISSFSTKMPFDSSAPTPIQPYEYKKPPKGDLSRFKSAISTILLLAIAPLIALSITAFAIQSYQVDGASMETTLQDHDRLIVDKLPRTLSRITNNTYIPHRGDIIIFNQANLPGTIYGEEKQLIKRVIGMPGERVVVKDGVITVYNRERPTGFNPDIETGYKITAPSTPGNVDVTLQTDEVFVCGDNRPNSEDSRYFGPIKADAIVGKLVLRLLPISNAQKF
jgi:signal peptidase I